MKPDNLHWDFREIDGYDCDFNFVISPREGGKSSGMWRKARSIFERGNRFIVTRQEKVAVSDIYINDCNGVLNKFIDDPNKRINFYYRVSQLEKGIVDVYANSVERPNKELLFRLIALSNKLSDMKSLFIPNCECHFGDEFIKNVRAGEKYLPQEAWKYKELINTFQREAPGRRFKSYMFGNPYSRANPYFVEFGVDINAIKRGKIWTRGKTLVQAYEIKEELRKYILDHNPLYQFDDSYTKYAFDGLAVNDQNMIIKAKQPRGFSLFCVVLIEGHRVGLYYSPFIQEFSYCYWVGDVPKMANDRIAYAFDFSDLQKNTILIDAYGKQLLAKFARAMECRKVAYANSQYGYWAETIYNYL